MIRLPRLPWGWREQPQLFERYWDETMSQIEKNFEAAENAQAVADAGQIVSAPVGASPGSVEAVPLFIPVAPGYLQVGSGLTGGGPMGNNVNVGVDTSVLMLRANNLSDVANTATARANLGIGTVIESNVPHSPGVALTDSVAIDITYVDLPVGTWLLTGGIQWAPTGGATPSILRAWIYDVSATQPTMTQAAGAFQSISNTGFPANNGQSISAGARLIVVPSGTTRVYLGTRTAFTSGTLVAGGHLTASRVL